MKWPLTVRDYIAQSKVTIRDAFENMPRARVTIDPEMLHRHDDLIEEINRRVRERWGLR